MTPRNMQLVFAGVLIALAVCQIAAEPQPGDVFREYKWIASAPDGTPGEQGRDWISEVPPNGGNGRVGGSLDNMGSNRPLPDMDLDGATKAEAFTEKVLIHDGTYGLAIAVNDNEFHTFPLADSIPEPQQLYQHHYFPEVELDVSELKASGNVFKMKVGGGTWWPQNIVYGVTVRVYYDDSKEHATGRITSLVNGQTVGLDPEITINATGGTDGIDRVEYVGLYEDFNYKGDGVYRQWQYRWIQGALKNNLGTSTEAPYSVTWENEWVPEQPEPMKFAARIVDGSGMIYMTKAVEDLKLARSGLLVEMCKPYSIPQKWVTRYGAGSEKFKVEGELSEAKGARLMVCVWQYEYSPIVQINGQNLGTFTAPALVANVKDIDVTPFKAGENTLTVPSGGHHGCEINWPGIVPFIQYEGPVEAGPDAKRAGAADAFSVVATSPGRIVIKVLQPGPHSLEIAAPNGRVLARYTGQGPQEYGLRATRLPAAGLYVARLCAGSVAYSAKLVISNRTSFTPETFSTRCTATAIAPKTMRATIRR